MPDIDEVERQCKHNIGFRFLACSAGDRYPGIWSCKSCVTFTLPYNPDQVKWMYCCDKNKVFSDINDGIGYLDTLTLTTTEV